MKLDLTPKDIDIIKKWFQLTFNVMWIDEERKGFIEQIDKKLKEWNFDFTTEELLEMATNVNWLAFTDFTNMSKYDDTLFKIKNKMYS